MTGRLDTTLTVGWLADIVKTSLLLSLSLPPSYTTSYSPLLLPLHIPFLFLELTHPLTLSTTSPSGLPTADKYAMRWWEQTKRPLKTLFDPYFKVRHPLSCCALLSFSFPYCAALHCCTLHYAPCPVSYALCTTNSTFSSPLIISCRPALALFIHHSLSLGSMLCCDRSLTLWRNSETLSWHRLIVWTKQTLL